MVLPKVFQRFAKNKRGFIVKLADKHATLAKHKNFKESSY